MLSDSGQLNTCLQALGWGNVGKSLSFPEPPPAKHTDSSGVPEESMSSQMFSVSMYQSPTTWLYSQFRSPTLMGHPFTPIQWPSPGTLCVATPSTWQSWSTGGQAYFTDEKTKAQRGLIGNYLTLGLSSIWPEFANAQIYLLQS